MFVQAGLGEATGVLVILLALVYFLAAIPLIGLIVFGIIRLCIRRWNYFRDP